MGGLASYVRTNEGAFWDQGVWDWWCGTAPETASGGSGRGEEEVTYYMLCLMLLLLDLFGQASQSAESHLLSLSNMWHLWHWWHKHSRHATLIWLVGMSWFTSSHLPFKEQDRYNVSDVWPSASSAANLQVERSVVRFQELGILAAILENIKSSGGNCWQGLIGLHVSNDSAYCWR